MRLSNDWMSFCAPVVPLARLPRFVYEEGDTLRLAVDMYNAWTQPIGSQRTVDVEQLTHL